MSGGMKLIPYAITSESLKLLSIYLYSVCYTEDVLASMLIMIPTESGHGI